jgi:DNA mismatch repair protein MutL
VGRIQALPETLRSQIAAGEVVERPASVVKELVENALDAVARSVRVQVEQGGLTAIVVADDGVGMDPEDAALSVQRHATSKLRTVEDLSALASYGFRGEALPSVGSVSRLTLLTRPAAEVEGTRVVVEGGNLLACQPCGCPAGTRVEVRDLFFNVPARRKFQKSARAETSHVEETLTRMSLASPGVDFRLEVDGRETLRAPAARGSDDETARAEAILGRNARGNLFAVEGPPGEVRVTGLVSNPVLSRADQKGLYLFVNGRYVRDRTLTHAVLESYRTLLEVGRYPVVVLKVDLPPHAVDVNVHPQKLEVRFQDGPSVHRAVTAALVPLLSRTPWLAGPTRSYTLHAPPAGEPAVADVGDIHRRRVTEALERYAGAVFSRGDPPPPPPSRPAFSAAGRATLPFTAPGLGGAGGFSHLRYLGQVGRTYLVCEGPEGMVVLDQHAADERVNFQRLRAAWDQGEVPAQGLLIPLRIALSRAEEEAVERHRDTLARAGFDVEPLGSPDVLLRAVPALLLGRSPERLCRDLLAELADTGSGQPMSNAVDALLSRVACHAAVRAGDALSPSEAAALLKSLDGVDLAAHCPHGRPVVRSVTLPAMAGWFDRG